MNILGWLGNLIVIVTMKTLLCDVTENIYNFLPECITNKGSLSFHEPFEELYLSHNPFHTFDFHENKMQIIQ